MNMFSKKQCRILKEIHDDHAYIVVWSLHYINRQVKLQTKRVNIYILLEYLEDVTNNMALIYTCSSYNTTCCWTPIVCCEFVGPTLAQNHHLPQTPPSTHPSERGARAARGGTPTPLGPAYVRHTRAPWCTRP